MQSRICMWSYGMVIIINWLYLVKVADSDPGIKHLFTGCNSVKVSSFSSFIDHLNATYRELRTRLSNGEQFAIAEQSNGLEPTYTLTQCRPYMSTSDCVACFDEASIHLVRYCSGALGAHVIYDGCFLKYETNNRYYGDGVLYDNGAVCESRTTSAPGGNFETSVRSLLSELQIAIPRIDGRYAATKKEVMGTGSNQTIYGIAQCGLRVTPQNCSTCLQVAYNNLEKCSNTDGRAYDTGCFMRFSDRPFFGDNQTTNLNHFLGKKGSSTKLVIVIGAVAATVAILIAFALFVWYKLSTKRNGRPKGDILDRTELKGPKRYSYKDLKYATKSFSEDNKLGEGGFGEVYKGTMKNGKIVAVKKLVLGKSDKVAEDFQSEVTLINNVHHRNLVRLLGYSNKGSKLLLVYEYVANRSLDRFLFGNEGRFLNWKQRFDILLGTAMGLTYLHEQFHVCIIHRDIKSSNILLDDAFQPKIADFGLVRLLPENETHVNTRFVGTLGYTAHEYTIHGQLSEKVDTFSYGVVVLEVVSGKQCNEIIVEPHAEYLLQRAWNLYENGKLLELVDKRLNANDFKVEQVKRVIQIALMCTQSSPALRPSMSEVVALLKSENSLEEKLLSRPPFIEFEENV